MADICKLGILSDIHYASAAERARGNDYEFRELPNRKLRLAVKWYRRFVWLHRPLDQNYLLDRFLDETRDVNFCVANGDYSCNSAFIGVSDDAARQSAVECLGKLRESFGPNFRATFGDHELGKTSFVGGRGGMRLASWERARQDLRLDPVWRAELGRFVLIGVVSSLIALPVFQKDTLPEEWAEWQRLREEHLRQVREAFDAVPPGSRLLFFCHDPTALPFLFEEEAVRRKLGQLERTIIGHLHSRLIFWQSRVLAGMRPIRSLGGTARRMSTALSQARQWKPFKVLLCPSLAGVELLKDGGFYTADMDLNGGHAVQFKLHRLRR